MAINGTTVLIGINTGTVAAAVFAVLGSQRGVTIDENTDPIDGSSKDSRARGVDAGRYSFSLSLDALYVQSSSEYAIMKQKFRAGEKLLIRHSKSGVDWEEANVLITNMSEDFPDQAEATISISMEGDGEWSAV